MIFKKNTISVLTFVFLLMQTCFLGVAYSQIKPYFQGPVNEAYVTAVGGDNLILSAIPMQPPEPINERIPRQTDMQAEWIPGYWAWQPEINNFVWVAGVWRRPPPGHLWISGFWKKFDEGWVWIHGFWNQVPESNINYIGIAPPDSIDENVAPPPSNQYEWSPGYWSFDHDKNQYQWVAGQWVQMDPNWILVPPHYVWRTGGYVYVPAYWDWPLEERGTVYAAALINNEYRYRAVYTPTEVVEPQEVIQSLFVYYPDYVYLFHHHYYYHPDYWVNCGCTPPWWGWDTWWSFTWRDQWSLWWWYSHPGYPQPYWITPELSSIIAPPSANVTGLFIKAVPPAIITQYGAISRGKLLQANSRVSGRFTPIVSYDKKVRDKIYSIARPTNVDREILRPNGRQLPINPSARRPNVRKPVVDAKAITTVPRISRDTEPRVPLKPRIPSSQRSAIWDLRQRPGEDNRVYTPTPVQKPTWSPRSRTIEDRTNYPDRREVPESWDNKEPIRRPSMYRVAPETRESTPQRGTTSQMREAPPQQRGAQMPQIREEPPQRGSPYER